MKINVILDNSFNNGFSVHGPRHQDGIVATYSAVEGQAPQWEIAQWFAYKNPFKADTEKKAFQNGGYQYSTPTFTLTVHPDDSLFDIKMEMRSSAEYQGHVRQEGEEWPHFLIQQGGFESYTPAISEMKSLEFKAALRLDYAENKMLKSDFDTAIHGCQVHQFITIQDMVTGDFIWFGIPFFDSRQQFFQGYCGIDGGKEDASGRLILIEKADTFTKESPWDNKWLYYDKDLLPLIHDAVRLARQKGIFKLASLEHMKLTSTNIGWEMFGEFDASFSIQNMSLLAQT